MIYYKKPQDLKYTDMAIWIDENAYSDSCDDTKLFEYLYHIMKMLSVQGKFFNHSADQDDYALYAATHIFMRYKDKRQFEERPHKVCKIKSALNYAKKLASPLRARYIQENNKTEINGLEEDFVYNSLQSIILSSVDELNVSHFKLYMNDITLTISNFLSSIPYRKNTAIWLNICISVLLTFLNSITLSKRNEQNLKRIENVKGTFVQDYVSKIYDEARNEPVILFHLDDKYRDYIFVLSNEIRHIVYADLSEMLHTYVPSDMEVVNRTLSFVELCNKGEEVE